MVGFCNPVPRPKFLANGLDYEFFHHPVPRPKFLTNGFDHEVLPGWIRIPGSRPRSKKGRCLLKFLLKRTSFLPRQGPWFSDGLVFWIFCCNPVPRPKFLANGLDCDIFRNPVPRPKFLTDGFNSSKLK